MLRTLGKRRAVLLLAALLATSLMGLGEAQGSASVGVEGFVYGPNGAPLQNASLCLWGFYLEAEVSTDSRGYYELSATTTEMSCQLYAFYDDPDIEGYDLLPSQTRLETDEDLTVCVNFTLQPAATVQVTGQLKPVESTKKITKFAFDVMDPVEGKVVQLEEYRLIYGTGMNVQSYFLDLDPSTLIVPADTTFVVVVSSSYQHERYPPSRYRSYRWRSRATRIDTFNKFTMVEGEGFRLGAGEVLDLDIRKYSLMADMTRIDPMIEEVEGQLSEVEDQGFYVAAESHDIKEAKDFLSGIDAKIESQEYEEAYVGLRQAYLKLLSVRGRLDTVIYEANFSIKVLLVFIAVTSVVLGSVLADGALLKLLLTIGSFVPMTLYLRQVFPGSSVIQPGGFASMAVTSLLGALFILSLLPRVLGDAVGDAGLARVGAIVAVFSMGNRSLRRRRLRSLFTFTTILTLTMSFVALTSLSTSYGLVFNRYGNDRPDAEGIMVRMPFYPPNDEFEKGVFSPIIAPTIEWAWENEGVVNVAEKADSIPSLRPYGRIGEWPIYGVIGLQPDVEPLMSLVDGALVEGGPLWEEGTCLLHYYMRNNARLEVGDEIVVKGVPLRIVGFFRGIGRIADVDGVTILPSYQVLVSPDPPTIEVRVCNEDEVVITTLETALSIDRVLVSRIDVELEPGADLEITGKSMALSREYRVWISEGGEAHIAYMGSQIGGKGFPIFVPWAIVILNVISTMLNSMFERRKEIDILSSIGLNPMHIAGVFLAEASILGVAGGSIGYLLGMGLYPLMKNLAWAPVVSQKISAVWLLASLGIAVASVIFGSMIALGWSVGLTPSLTMRWNLGDQEIGDRDEWETRLPVRIAVENLEEFLSFMLGYLERFSNFESVPRISSMKLMEEGEARVLSFIYNARDTSIGTTMTINVITLARGEEGVYVPTLVSRGARDAARTTGTFIRKIVIRWSTETGRES
jgi:hypothetical protein